MPPTGVQTSRRVPANKVAEVRAGYQIDDPIKIETKDNGDGTFDVIATFSEATQSGGSGTLGGGAGNGGSGNN